MTGNDWAWVLTVSAAALVLFAWALYVFTG